MGIDIGNILALSINPINPDQSETKYTHHPIQ